MFSSSWGNNQQSQQQPNAFGQPSAFGSTTNNAFGSTSAFGQQPAQQTAAPQVNPMFGNITTAPATNTTTGGFGTFGGNNANASTGAFGALKPATGFGAFSGGGTGAFGGAATGAFGQPATTTAAPNTSVFGQPASTTSAFGAFGGNKFGTTTSSTTGSNPVVTTGTSTPAYSTTPDKDGTLTLQYQSISCMPQYLGYSHEELRVQDYAQNRKTASTTTGAFGQSAFGAAQPTTTGLFGAQPAQQPTTSIFGGNTNTTGTTTNTFGAFGQSAAPPAANTGSVFGSGTGAFGQTQPQQTTGTFGSTNVFGQQQPQQQTSVFGGGTGTSAFGTTTNKPAFSAFGGGGAAGGTGTFGTGTGASAFGSTQAQQQPAATTNLFGNPQPAANTQTSAFGAFGNTAAAKPSIFGTPATTQTTSTPFGAFGNNQQQSQPQQNAQPSLFGGNNSLFGQQPQQQQQNQQPAQTTSLFGGGQTTTPSLFGNNTGTTTSLFGNNNQQQNQQPQQQGQQQQNTSLFGNMFNKPAQPTTSLFGGGALSQPQPNTNQQQQQQPSLFGNTFGQSGQTTSLFGGNKPAAPGLGGSLSGSQGFGGSLFGGSTMNASQGSLTASIAQPISDNLPIFAILPPGPRSIDLEPSVASPKKRPGFFYDMPVRTPVPRIGLNYTPPNSKLRGYGSVSMTSSTNGVNNPLKASVSFTTGKPGALALSNSDALSSSVGPDFLGRSGSPALGTGGRQSVKKVILDKKVDPSDLFVKTGSPGASRKGKIVFSPQMTVHAREYDNSATAPARSVYDSPAVQPKVQLQTKSPTRSGPLAAKETNTTPEIQEEVSATELVQGDYWVRPDLATLKKVGYDQLSSFEGLVVGRKGYGEIHFLEPVDLTGLPKLGSLLGEVIRFDDKECSVYPDCEEGDKPPPGSGLNVKAKLILERCWAVDKATREPIMDPNAPHAIKHLKRLKNMKETHFVSFDDKTGTWTFTVDHF